MLHPLPWWIHYFLISLSLFLTTGCRQSAHFFRRCNLLTWTADRCRRAPPSWFSENETNALFYPCGEDRSPLPSTPPISYIKFLLATRDLKFDSLVMFCQLVNPCALLKIDNSILKIYLVRKIFRGVNSLYTVKLSNEDKCSAAIMPSKFEINLKQCRGTRFHSDFVIISYNY